MAMITPSQLAETVIRSITDREINNAQIVNVNNKDLSKRGDLSFHLGLDYWRNYVDTKTDWFINSKNILCYFMHKYLNNQYSAFGDDQNNCNLLDLLKKRITEELEKKYGISNLNIQLTFNISCNFVLINFNRSIASCVAIKTIIKQNFRYRRTQNYDKNFQLQVESDDESEITNMRLNLLRKVSLNLLKFKNYIVCNNKCDNNYIFTTKSQGNINKDYNRYLCGVVLNNNKKKEINCTKHIYLQRKIQQIKELNSHKSSSIDIDKNNIQTDTQKLAAASICYELLSVKHSSPVIFQNSDKLDNSIKEAAFILYNNARITAILEKYMILVQKENFPEIISIEKLESFKYITDEESWSLIYNYIIKYSDVLEDVVKIAPKFEINIQMLCSFISSLCHAFSKYYRKNKILLRGVPGNDQVILITTERIHMLRALQIILQNSLFLLEIEELKCM